MRIVSEFIAPWSLPNEDIPIHLMWENPEDVSELRVNLPESLVIVDMFNIKPELKQSFRCTVPVSALQVPCYFGLVIRCERIFEESMKELPIEIDFALKDNTILSRKLTARIVRPIVSISKAPQKVVISDTSDRNTTLRFEVTHSGLGRVQVNIQVKTEGSVISQPDSLYLEILEELAEENELATTQAPVDKYIQLDWTLLRSEALKMIERIQRGDTHIDDPDFLARITQLLRDDQAKQKLTEAIYTRIGRLMIAAILDYMDMYPNEDIELQNGKIKTIFKAELNRLNVILRYSDSKGNMYPEVSTVVEVEDRRMAKDKVFEMPINIDWKTETMEFGN